MNETQLIEKTSKELKANLAFWVVAMLLGLAMLGIGCLITDNQLFFVGSAIAVSGVVGTIVMKVKIWWMHG